MDTNKTYFTNIQMRNALIQIEDQMVHSNWMPSLILGIKEEILNYLIIIIIIDGSYTL